MLEKAKEQLGGEYIPIDPENNAIKAILQDLGKANLTPNEVEELCKTAKVPSLNGFVRLDTLPCGCERIYKGMILGHHQDPHNFTIRIGGIEGVKPCQRHIKLIEKIRLREY